MLPPCIFDYSCLILHPLTFRRYAKQRRSSRFRLSPYNVVAIYKNMLYTEFNKFLIICGPCTASKGACSLKGNPTMRTAKPLSRLARKHQWGTEHRTHPLPIVHERPSTRKI